MSKETGGQAFPIPATEWNEHHVGMTLRDYFAGQAMVEVMRQNTEILRGKADMRQVSQTCYSIADAMIEVRK